METNPNSRWLQTLQENNHYHNSSKSNQFTTYLPCLVIEVAQQECTNRFRNRYPHQQIQNLTYTLPSKFIKSSKCSSNSKSHPNNKALPWRILSTMLSTLKQINSLNTTHKMSTTRYLSATRTMRSFNS